jgi:hypothetical protein
MDTLVESVRGRIEERQKTVRSGVHKSYNVSGTGRKEWLQYTTKLKIETNSDRTQILSDRMLCQNSEC